MGPKRKRNERGSVDSGESRPSPHRPGNTALGGNQDRDGDTRHGGDGRRRSSQRNTRNPRPQRNDRRESSDNFANSPTTGRPSTGTMSPPRRPSISTQSQPATPAPLTPVLAPAKASTPEPARIISPYDYAFVTDERIAAWTTSGRQEVVATGIQAMDDVDILDLSSIFQELIRSALDSRINATDVGECIKSILRPDTASEEEFMDKLDGPSLFLDSVSILADNEPASPALLNLMVASGVSPMLMRQMLDTPLLQSLGLTRNTFLKAGIRQVTNLLYRQANHNLLREETEGYSKLMTELYTAAGSAPPTSDAVEETFERVKGLIGTFDLDVGRVLDVTLDVFASVLIKQFRFFIKLLRVSSWWPRDTVLAGSAKLTHENGGLPKWALPGADNWTTTEEDAKIAFPQRLERDQRFWDRAREKGLDAFFELGGRQAIDSNTKELLLASPPSTDLDADADREWIETTGTLPPSGNRTAAQLLGFKLRFYTSDARDKEDSFPPNLLYLAALLIKIGFISLRDLYPHLYPLDKDMESLRESKMTEITEKEKANRPGGGENALMRAGALADDTLPAANRSRDAATTKAEATAASAEVEEKDKLPEPEDQKVLLLINLLTIGAIPESLFILGRFPWLPEAYPEIYPLLHRILHESIDKIYKETLPVPRVDIASTGKPWPDPDQNGASKGSIKLLDAHVRRPLRWPFPEKRDVNDGIIYKFYWDEWTDSIPVCQTVDDIFTLGDTFLNLSGVNIGRDATLLSKLAAIGNKSLADDRSESNLARWQDLLKRLLVPALSLTKANTSVVNDIYEMLRYYPTPVRYTIYAEWFEGQISRLPAMTTSFKRTRLETLSTMKRISKENITTMARTLAKSAYASPGIVFKVALDQIEAYSNLTEVVVECAKYFTDLGYDVLIWSLMSSLGGKSRSRTRDDSALLTSRWLIALSKFSGKIFKRYSNMSPAPILQYANDQLYRGNSTDLIILEELIAQMSGVVSDIDFTDSQLSAMTGGEILRRQTLISLQDKRFESAKTAKRLMKALTETKLAGTLLISIAQHRQSAIYSVPAEDAHIKYLSTLVDDAQRILGQYLDLLLSNLSVEEFDELVPNTCDLMADFGLEPALAFAIGRTSYAKRMAAAPSTPPLKKDVSSENTQVDADGDVGMDAALINATVKSDEASKINGSTPTNGDVQMAEILEADSATIALSPSSTSTDVWHDVLTPLVAAVQKALPEKTWDILSPEFYVIFWQLALSDIQLPMESYTTENTRLTREISDIMKDRSDMSRPGMNRKEEARKALEATRDELLKESKQNMIKYERTRARLNKEKSKWFSGTKKRYDAVNDALLEDCFLPRLLLSPSDSDYCFKMIKFLHSSGAPYFRTLGLYGRLFRGNRLRSMIFTCTIREAECLGRFLRSVLSDLSRWHSSKAVYEKEAYGPSGDLPGFAKRLTPDGKPLDLLDYEEFRRIVYTWHRNLNTALKVALSGTEWMHIRNAITVLKTVVQYFPAVDFMGKYFQTQLTTIGDREKNVREDLCLLANASMPEMRKRERKWVMLQSFATNLGETGPVNGIPPKTSSGAPQRDSKTALKPTAPEFKPSRSVSNSKPARKTTAKEVEDGEVDDAKASAAKEKSAAEKSNIGKTPANDTKPTSSAKFSTPSGPSSDIGPNQVPLGKREPSREDATKPPSSTLPPRGDFNRNSIPDRPPAGLPSRPDAPIPRGLPSDRHLPGRLPERREMHPSRMEGPGRNWQDRRNPDMPPPRDFGRPERGPPFDRSRDRHDPMRRGGELFADTRERDNSATEPRQPELNGRPSRDDLAAPSRPTVPPPDRGPIINPERLPIINQDQKEAINPARAALISGSADFPRAESPRGLRDDLRGERPGSRAHSPRRGDRHGGGDRDPFDGRRGERPPGARGPPEDIRPNRRDDNQSGPFPPRFDRNNDRLGPDKGRDVFQPAPPPHRPMDPDHGRLNQASRQPDPNFGRLNAASPQAPDIPSGPRNTRGGMRQSSGNAPRGDHRSMQGTPRQQSPDRQPPTGPANDRTLRRPESVPSSSTVTVSATTNVGAPSPTAAIHPERLRQLSPDVQAQVNTPVRNNQSDDAAAAGIHPDRLRAFQNDQPPPRAPPLQTSNFRQEAAASPPMSGPPSGPKSQGAQTPTSSTPNGLNAPTGPSSSNERIRGPMRQLAGINSILQPQNDRSQGRDWGMNVRGRGNVATSSGVPKRPDSRPTTPVHNRPEPRENARGARDSAPAEQPQQAPDLFSNRVTKTEDDRSGSRAGRDGGSSRRDARSGRHSHRPSRSRSPAPERERGERSHRERDHAGTLQEVRTDAGGNSSRNEFRETRGGKHRDAGERDRRTSGKNPATDGGGGGGGDGRERGGRRDGGRDDKRVAEGVNEWSRNVPPPPPGPPPGRDGGDRRSGRDDRQDRRVGGRDDGGSGSKRRGDDGRPDGRGRDNKRPRQS